MHETIGSVEIRSVREGFGEGFALWDRSVDDGDTKGAKTARKMMQLAALALLPKPAAEEPGWYMFADIDAGISGIHYIGIAKTRMRPMGRRIVDRFRDDSCFDVRLDELPETQQREIVTGRLATALPRSGVNYVDKHIKISKLIRASTHIFMVGSGDEPCSIAEVERLLIGTASVLGGASQNVQHRTLRAGVSDATVAAALSVLGQLDRLGFSRPAIENWREVVDHVPRHRE